MKNEEKEVYTNEEKELYLKFDEAQKGLDKEREEANTKK